MADKNRKKQNSASSTEKKKRPNIYAIVGLVLFAGLILFLVYTNFLKKNEVDKEYMFRKDGELTFMDSTGNVKDKIDIQIANTEFDRELGLMFRKNMEENQGMLFIFPEASIQNFWMRNTLISLDMIFVNQDKKIITIRKNTTKLSDQTYSSTGPAMYVIEVNAGFADRYNIKVGDKIEWTKTKSIPPED
jgi:uncharacterized protein